MNRCDVSALCAALAHIEGYEVEVGKLRKSRGAGAEVNPSVVAAIRHNVGSLINICGQIGLESTVRALRNEDSFLQSKEWVKTAASLESHLRMIRVHVVQGLHSIEFLYVAQDRTTCVDHEALFGESVKSAFPSAAGDIVAAGNCLAAECSTAAVFHLMRAAEIGLRALAWDRRVKVKRTRRDVPLELVTWDEIIKALEDSEKEIQSYPKTLAREAQFEFYHGAMMEFRRFKNKFRNRIMHARVHYDRDQAHSALMHVREFMTILSGKISESSHTPKRWGKAQVP